DAKKKPMKLALATSMILQICYKTKRDFIKISLTSIQTPRAPRARFCAPGQIAQQRRERDKTIPRKALFPGASIRMRTK
ncbi:MAG: hypothetical protein LUB58_02025, partial [Oscillospiraceae bacterium]|nr:hypothetical protein [Oscillospiraceae bacterium]